MIGENRRFLSMDGGDPFFWLGDTAWDLLARMSREDIDYYLRIRAAQRFSVIQVAAVTTDAAGAPRANALGQPAFVDGDRSRPSDDYFIHLDYLTGRAAAHGMHVAVLPWYSGAHVSAGPALDPGVAQGFATWLGTRYRNQPLMWLIPGSAYAQQGNALASAFGPALREHGGGTQLIARLPSATTPVDPVRQPWLDLELRSCGSGCAAVWRVGSQQADGMNQTPCAVAGDAQACAVGIAAAVRRGGYSAVFAGACGFSFIDETVWSVRDGNDAASASASTASWREALFHSAAEDMQFLRQLVESRPYQCRIADQGMIVGSNLTGMERIGATRGDDGPAGQAGSYAFVYSGGGRPVTVDLTRLTGTLIMASWFDPRTGVSTWLGQFAVRGQRAFTPPTRDDWVLVLEDSGRHFQQLGFGSDRRSNS
jgi:hypothetical protein